MVGEINLRLFLFTVYGCIDYLLNLGRLFLEQFPRYQIRRKTSNDERIIIYIGCLAYSG